MPHMIAIWLAAAAFAGAGIVNALGRPAQRDSFARWGYPAWRCRATGALEVMTAVLVAVPATRPAGLALGAAVVAVAAVTVLRHREFGHLAPLGTFAVLLGLAAA